MTAQLWIAMVSELKKNHRLPVVPFELMQRIMTTPKKGVPDLLERQARS